MHGEGVPQLEVLPDALEEVVREVGRAAERGTVRAVDAFVYLPADLGHRARVAVVLDVRQGGVVQLDVQDLFVEVVLRAGLDDAVRTLGATELCDEQVGRGRVPDGDGTFGDFNADGEKVFRVEVG